MEHIIAFGIGIVYGHVVEYTAHKHLLHRYRKRNEPFSFHFAKHHGESRRNLMVDNVSITNFNPMKNRDLLMVLIVLVLNLPFLFYFPAFYAACVFSAIQYYYLHRKAHHDISWGKLNLPWHYDHHMGPNQDVNWGVRSDILDRILGTREKYYGTIKEVIDNSKRMRFK
jgi:sterol desaturase/sphingolipid hydroxylase (fatty acid hydroxylase superfamily)